MNAQNDTKLYRCLIVRVLATVAIVLGAEAGVALAVMEKPVPRTAVGPKRGAIVEG